MKRGAIRDPEVHDAASFSWIPDLPCFASVVRNDVFSECDTVSKPEFKKRRSGKSGTFPLLKSDPYSKRYSFSGRTTIFGYRGRG